MIEHIQHTIAKCKAGDRIAQKELFAEYNKKLFATCMKYMNTRTAAEELLQESWILIFNSLDRYQDQGKFEGWMKTIVIRKAWKMIKQTKRTEELEIVKEQFHSREENQLIDKMTCEEILNVVEELPAGSREVFKMFVIDGYDHQEIADILEISNSTSRAHLSRARKMMKQKMEKMNKIFL